MEMGNSPAGALEAGIKLFNEGNLEAAITSLQEIVKADPMNAKAHVYLGAAFGQLGKYEPAINEFVQLTRLEPRNASHYYNLGRTYESLGDKEKATSAYKQSLLIKPDYDKAKTAVVRLTASQTAPKPAPTTVPPSQLKQDADQVPQAPWQSGAQQGSSVSSPYGQQNSPYGQPPYGTQSYDPNNVPPEIFGLNWGAFLMPFLWSIAHNVWIGLLCLIPYAGVIMQFVLLFKGNEWGWQKRQFESVDEFKKVQRIWLIWGLVLCAISLLFVILAIVFPVFARARHAAMMHTQPMMNN